MDSKPVKIADLKAILEELEAEGHTEIETIWLAGMEYKCNELPEYTTENGKLSLYFNETL